MSHFLLIATKSKSNPTVPTPHIHNNLNFRSTSQVSQSSLPAGFYNS